MKPSADPMSQFLKSTRRIHPLFLGMPVPMMLLAGFIAVAPRASRAEEGIAVAIIYDTSGSMKEPVADAHGKSAAKFEIANRALLDVTRQLESYTTNSPGPAKRLSAGLFVFQGEQAREAVKLGPFDRASMEDFATHFSRPQGNTPLGNALLVAGRALLESPLSRKHIVVITDGLNTAGPTPQAVIPRVRQMAERQQASISMHFVAFDIDARQFAPLKRQGVTVVGAADEQQLNSQLQFILQQKILLEDEEPSKPR
jgi:hypothetical protein